MTPLLVGCSRSFAGFLSPSRATLLPCKHVLTDFVSHLLVQKCQSRRMSLVYMSLPAQELTYLFVQYLSAIWNVINFEEAEVRFKEAV